MLVPDSSCPELSILSESCLRSPAAQLIRTVACNYWRRLFLTYGLFIAEIGISLFQPVCLGLAIDGLLTGHLTGWWLLFAAYLGNIAVGTARRIYDSRSFMTIFKEVVGDMVVRQRATGVTVSHVASHSALARTLVEFFENDLPLAMHAASALVGSLIMLSLYDWNAAVACAVLMVPCCVLNIWAQQRLSQHNRALHDQMEQEVDVITRSCSTEIRDHYRRVASSWISISNFDALNIGGAELLLTVLVVGTLLHLSSQPGTTSGDIYVVLRYVLMFVTGVGGVPAFLRQFTRFRDVARRIVVHS